MQGNRHTAFVFGGVISQVHVCDACSHVFFFPRPTEQQLAEHYGGPWNEGSGYSIDFCYEAWISKISLPMHKPKATFVETVCRLRDKYFHGAPHLRIHDAGCGYGALVAKFNLLGFDATGSDIDAQSIEAANRRGNPDVFRCHFRDIPGLVPGGVHILTCYHSLEHYPEPLEFFRAVKYALRPGGLFIMAVPNGAYLPARIDYFGKYDWCFYPGHLHYFTPVSARVLLAKAGLRLIRAFSCDWDGTQEDWLVETASQLARFRLAGRRQLLRRLANRVMTRDLRVVAINPGESGCAEPNTTLQRAGSVIRRARTALFNRGRSFRIPRVPAALRSRRVISSAACDEMITEGTRVIGYEISRCRTDYFLSLHWRTDQNLSADYLVVLHVQEFGVAEDEFVNLDFAPWPPTTRWRPCERVTVLRQLASPRTIEWRPDEARNLVHERPFPPGKYYLRVGLWDLNRGLVGKLATIGPIVLPDS